MIYYNKKEMLNPLGSTRHDPCKGRYNFLDYYIHREVLHLQGSYSTLEIGMNQVQSKEEEPSKLLGSVFDGERLTSIRVVPPERRASEE